MNTKKVIEVNRNIREARDKEITYLKTISEYMQEIMNACPHELVVRLRSSHHRKMLAGSSYYCPACDMMYFNLPDYQGLVQTQFSHSKVLDLSQLTLLTDKDTLDTIKDEVLKDYDGYLNGSNLDELKETLKAKEYDYDEPSCQIRRVLKNTSEN